MATERYEYVLLDEDLSNVQEQRRKNGRILLVTVVTSGLLALIALSIYSAHWIHHIVADDTLSPDRAVSLQTISKTMHESFAIEQDTQPPLPKDLDSGDERYLSYLTHSGLHNQRINLSNALLLGALLNRTVLVPYVRLGRAIGFGDWEGMQTNLEEGEKAIRVKTCRPLYENGSRMEGYCAHYDEYTDVSYSYLFNLSSLAPVVSMQERTTQAKDYLTSSTGLGVAGEDILTFPTDERYDYELLEDTAPSDSHYSRSIDIASLLTPEMQSKKVLAFGSLYGHRIKLVRPESLALQQQINEIFTIENRVVTSLANQAIDVLGGRKNYIAIHCRVGGSQFEANAEENMQHIFRQLLAHPAINIDEATSERFENGELSISSIQGEAYQDLSKASSFTQCQKLSYSDDRYASLNTPLFIATDSHHPREDPYLKIFFQTFSCVFILSDFDEAAISDIALFEKIFSKQDGLPLRSFLVPLLDAQIASKSGIGFFGTRGSTFSGYLATLQAFYAADLDGV